MHTKRNLITTFTLAAALAVAAVPTARAETVIVPVGSQADRSSVKLPGTGLAGKTVRERWGSPQEIRGPVGDPAITQWHYPEFVVYLEHNRVIHAVIKRNGK
ncbi:MAG TPA: hypothetical protein VKY53_06115 [Marinobacter sp.]|nr:hypothetical protein [Marinobacter sp.]